MSNEIEQNFFFLKNQSTFIEECNLIKFIVNISIKMLYKTISFSNQNKINHSKTIKAHQKLSIKQIST